MVLIIQVKKRFRWLLEPLPELSRTARARTNLMWNLWRLPEFQPFLADVKHKAVMGFISVVKALRDESKCGYVCASRIKIEAKPDSMENWKHALEDQLIQPFHPSRVCLFCLHFCQIPQQQTLIIAVAIYDSKSNNQTHLCMLILNRINESRRDLLPQRQKWIL